MLPKTKISEKITTNLSASFGKSWCSFRQQTEWRRRVWLCIWGEFQNTMRRMLCLGVIWRLCLVRHYWDPGKIPYNYDNNPWGYFLFYRFFGRLVVRGEGRRGVLSCYKWIPANCRRRIGIQKSAVQRDVSLKSSVYSPVYTGGVDCLWHGLASNSFVFISKIYTALLLCSENEATSTLSSLVDMPHQTRLVELLIASPEVRNEKNTNANS